MISMLNISELKERALTILESIESRIGFHKTGLVKAAIDDPLVDSFENLALALAYLVMNKPKKFTQLVKGVEKEIGFNLEGFLINKLGGNKIYTSDQALLVLCLQNLDSQRAKQLTKNILFFVDQEKWLVPNGKDDERIYTFNFLLAAKALN